MNNGYSQDELYRKDANGTTLIDRMAEFNNLKDANLIQVGQEIRIPKREGSNSEVDSRSSEVSPQASVETQTSTVETSTTNSPQPTASEEGQELQDAVHRVAHNGEELAAVNVLRNSDNAKALGALMNDNRTSEGNDFSQRDLNFGAYASKRGLTNDIVLRDGRVDWHLTTEAFQGRRDGTLTNPHLASTQLRRVYDALPNSLSPEQKIARMGEIFDSARTLDKSRNLENKFKRESAGNGYSSEVLNDYYTKRFAANIEKAQRMLDAERYLGRAS